MTRILLIDDDKGVRETIGRILSLAGHDVEYAGDGAAGLSSLKTRKPDVVICDILMPEKEGIETILEIRNSNHNMPIIAISGGGDYARDKQGFADDNLESARLFGANYTLRKPFRPAELLELVDQAGSGTKDAEP